MCIDPIFGTCILDALLQALNIWNDYVSYIGSSPKGIYRLFACVVFLLTWVLLLPFPSQLLFVNLFCILLMVHLGYLHLTKASLRCCNSTLRSSGVVDTGLALWVSVPMTLYLAERLWWLSHCKYWSVWVGFWYTVILKELSSSGLTKKSRNGITPFSWLPSTVNFIAGSKLFMWSSNNHLWTCFWMAKVLSTNLNQNLWGHKQTSGLPFQNAPGTGWQLWGWPVTPWLLPQPVHRIYFGKRSMQCADRMPEVQWCSVLTIQTCPTRYHPVPIDL